MNILFVCSKNKWRSRTAETIFKNSVQHHVKSAGTDEGARIKLTAKQLSWADVVFVMEKKHKQIISQKFAHDIESSNIIVLDIADEYEYMNEELIEHLQTAVIGYIDDLIV